MIPEAILRILPSVQPLVFETDITDCPYSTGGSLFLVGYKGRAFVLTARHAHSPENCSPICVFPTDTSQRVLPLKNYFFVSSSDVPDDFADFVAIEIDMAKINDTEVGEAQLINLDLALGDWLSKADIAEMYVVGYPNEYSCVDYQQEALANHRLTLCGRYVGASESDHLHVLEVFDTNNLETFSGFSGGPVFAWIVHPGNRGEIVFCGMTLRGTPASRRFHFLDRSLLLHGMEIFSNKLSRKIL
ncbi:MAG: hypothetical protein JXK94_09220 [Deltaproteobacteria bacterium]|nr:hypothetical protein [Deltaproteobacteria bacterium]